MSRKILLVDDHLLFADAVKFLLDSSGADIEAQVFSSLASVLDYLSTDAAVDLLLLDYSMPGASGIEAVETVATRRPGLPIAFLSGLDDPQVAGEALQRGVIGWLPKSMPGEALINVLNLVLAGERFVPADLLLRQQSSPLTPREQDVAALLARGLSDKEIAEHLSLQVGTVKVHVKSLLRKFDAPNRTHFALRYRGA